MTLEEFDRAIDNHRRRWKRAVLILNLGPTGDGACNYVLYDQSGREVMQTRWTPPIAESLRTEFGWERSKLKA